MQARCRQGGNAILKVSQRSGRLAAHLSIQVTREVIGHQVVVATCAHSNTCNSQFMRTASTHPCALVRIPTCDCHAEEACGDAESAGVRHTCCDGVHDWAKVVLPAKVATAHQLNHMREAWVWYEGLALSAQPGHLQDNHTKQALSTQQQAVALQQLAISTCAQDRAHCPSTRPGCIQHRCMHDPTP